MNGTLAQQHRSALDEAIKAALVNKGFDPKDLLFLAKNGVIIEHEGVSTLVVNKQGICYWRGPLINITTDGFTVKVTADFEFEEL